MNFNFRRHRDLGDSLSAVFAFLRQEFKPLFKSLIIYAGPFVLVGSFFAALYQSNMISSGILQDQSSDPLAVYRNMFSLDYLIALLGMLISHFMIMSVVFSYIKVYVEKGKDQLELDNVWSEIRTNFVTIFVSSFLLLVIYIVSMISIFLLLIPFVYLVIATSLVIYIQIAEDISFGEAFRRSLYLVRNNWWQTFGTMFITGLVASIGSGIVSLPNTIIVMFYTINAIGDANAASPSFIITLVSVFASFFASLFNAFTYITVAVLYYSYVEQKDSPDLSDRINQIDNDDLSIVERNSNNKLRPEDFR